MNQKQRDLLTRMVAERRESVLRFLRWKKTLCHLHPSDLWNDDSDGSNEIPPDLEPEYLELRQKGRELVARWAKLCSKQDRAIKVEERKHSSELQKVKRSFEGAILKIQFAEDAEEAQKILDSLPKAEDVE